MWRDVCSTDELALCRVMEISVDGDDLLLYRLDDGSVAAVTAYCPHMNHYMPNGLAPGTAISGLLQGNELRCPFHGWRFDGSGRCTFLPDGQRVPAAVRMGRPVLRHRRVRERAGRLELECPPGKSS